jgi:hypothetical protein
MVGLRSSTPRVSFGGPVIANHLFILESIQYEMRETPVITLPFPNNESRHEGYNSLTAIDYTYLISGRKSALLDLKGLDLADEMMHPGSWNIWNRSAAKN